MGQNADSVRLASAVRAWMRTVAGVVNESELDTITFTDTYFDLQEALAWTDGVHCHSMEDGTPLTCEFIKGHDGPHSYDSAALRPQSGPHIDALSLVGTFPIPGTSDRYRLWQEVVKMVPNDRSASD